MGLRNLFGIGDKKQEKGKDPVCGMGVNLIAAQHKSTFQGKVYGFCSGHCKETFDKNPLQYAAGNS